MGNVLNTPLFNCSLNYNVHDIFLFRHLLGLAICWLNMRKSFGLFSQLTWIGYCQSRHLIPGTLFLCSRYSMTILGQMVCIGKMIFCWTFYPCRRYIHFRRMFATHHSQLHKIKYSDLVSTVKSILPCQSVRM